MTISFQTIYTGGGIQQWVNGLYGKYNQKSIFTSAVDVVMFPQAAE